MSARPTSRTALLARAVCAVSVAALAVLTTGAGAALADPGDHPNAHASGNAPASDNSSPQPPSNADFSGHGANVHGPYDSTRDGSPSLNGNGGGNALGKPCAGCVGKADNKNPNGQMPGGSDANRGYECDANNGIGKSNPAHTSCRVTEQPPTNPPGTPPATPPAEVPPANAAPAAAAAAPAAEAAAAPPKLAKTGADVFDEVLIGLWLTALGAGTVAASRRRTA